MNVARDGATRAAVALWSALAVGTIARVVFAPLRQHFHVFRDGALLWWDGVSMYDHQLVWFRHSPPFAVLIGPFAALPIWLGNILWNLLTIGLLVYSMLQLTRWVLPAAWTVRRRALLLILVLPGVIRGIWSSQAHGFSAAFLFLGLVGIARKRWWIAGLLFAAAFYIKVAPLAMALIFLATCVRRFTIPYLAGLIGLFLLPFLTQDPRFVLSEYGRWLHTLGSSSSERWPSIRDVWHLWELTGLPFSVLAYRIVQTVAGCATGMWCIWLTRRSTSESQVLTSCFAIGACYMLLFGPAVEYNQWVLVAPFLAWALLRSIERKSGRIVAIAAYAMTLILGAGPMERLLGGLTGSPWATASIVIGTLLFTGWLIWDAHRSLAVSAAGAL